MKHLLSLALISLSFIHKALSQEYYPPGYDFQKEFLKDTNRVHNAVDKEPEFPGGMDGLNLYLKKNLKWPETSHAIQRIIVSFVVERDGTLTNIKPTRALYPAYEAEAIRIMKVGPKWSPGYDKGKLVRVMYTIPVDFQIIQ